MPKLLVWNLPDLFRHPCISLAKTLRAHRTGERANTPKQLLIKVFSSISIQDTLHGKVGKSCLTLHSLWHLVVVSLPRQHSAYIRIIVLVSQTSQHPPPKKKILKCYASDTEIKNPKIRNLCHSNIYSTYSKPHERIENCYFHI